MNQIEKQVHDLVQRVATLESEVAELKAAKVAPVADPSPAEEPAATDETPAA